MVPLNEKGETTMNTKNKPVHDVRLGAIKAAIWANSTPKGIRHSVTLTRLYKDGENWKYSDSFGRDDLPLIEKVADEAFRWICANAKSASDTAPETELVEEAVAEVNV
jgi:hypothetical protein